MILKAQITLSTEEYTVLQQVAKEGITIQELLAQRFQDLVDKEIEKALEQMSKERQQ